MREGALLYNRQHARHASLFWEAMRISVIGTSMQHAASPEEVCLWDEVKQSVMRVTRGQIPVLQFMELAGTGCSNILRNTCLMVFQDCLAAFTNPVRTIGGLGTHGASARQSWQEKIWRLKQSMTLHIPWMASSFQFRAISIPIFERKNVQFAWRRHNRQMRMAVIAVPTRGRGRRASQRAITTSVVCTVSVHVRSDANRSIRALAFLAWKMNEPSEDFIGMF